MKKRSTELLVYSGRLPRDGHGPRTSNVRRRRRRATRLSGAAELATNEQDAALMRRRITGLCD